MGQKTINVNVNDLLEYIDNAGLQCERVDTFFEVLQNVIGRELDCDNKYLSLFEILKNEIKLLSETIKNHEHLLKRGMPKNGI